MASYFWDIPLKKYESLLSGELTIALVNGRKVLNTQRVNYSYSSLHKVFQAVFKKSHLKNHLPQQVLMLGLGGGSIVEILRRDYGSIAPITVIEIDPVIIDIAKLEFNIDQYKPIDIIQMDAIDYINNSPAIYDMICIDIFINELVPDPFLTNDFVQRLIHILDQGGWIYFNIMISNTGLQSKFDGILEFLRRKKGHEIAEVTFYEIEENNRVLVVRK